MLTEVLKRLGSKKSKKGTKILLKDLLSILKPVNVTDIITFNIIYYKDRNIEHSRMSGTYKDIVESVLDSSYVTHISYEKNPIAIQIEAMIH